MFGLGELVILLIYLILCIPPLLIIALLVLREKEFLTKGLIYLTLALLPIILFSHHQYAKHREAELKYVGTYYLSEFPNCDSCILHLKDNNSYSVTTQEHEIENGAWEYCSGSDYFIVYIGEYGQLGGGDYKYSYSENDFIK